MPFRGLQLLVGFGFRVYGFKGWRVSVSKLPALSIPMPVHPKTPAHGELLILVEVVAGAWPIRQRAPTRLPVRAFEDELGAPWPSGLQRILGFRVVG